MAVDLTKVKEREALPHRREPYWQRLTPGLFIGYRPSVREGAGTWIARAYDAETQRYRLRALGGFSELPTRERFGAAKKESEAYALSLADGGVEDSQVHTVADACRSFCSGNSEVAARFKRYVYSDPLANVPIIKLRRAHLEAWRLRLKATPALVSRRKEGAKVTRPRSDATINRDMAALRAALSKVLAPGPPSTQAAWQDALRPVKNAVRRRELYLDRDQRRALLKFVSPEAQLFVRALCALPLRPGALASLTLADFDVRTSELTISKDKSGRGRRIVIPAAAAELFLRKRSDDSHSAPLFVRENGKPWTKESWNSPLAAAATKASLPPGVTAYTLRHSTITDLVKSGLPLLTVAQISGTSAAMIEAHYGHLTRDAAVNALETLAL